MSHRIVERAEARLDFWKIVEYLASQNVGAAERFIDAVEQTHAFLAEFPFTGVLVEDDELRNIRICPVTGFRNYLIVFRPENERVDIMHYTQASRDLNALLQDL